MTAYAKYELLERIGEGGMAEVFLARSLSPMGLERFVALKRALQTDDADEVQRLFIDEARLLMWLNHPSLVTLYDFGVEENLCFMVMEYVAGADLRQLIRRARDLKVRIPTEWALAVLASVCRGLDYAHKFKDPEGRALHIVHRDVTPSNILVSYDGHPKLSDFGIARRAFKSESTGAGTLKGKIRYMSPEQAGAEKLDHRSDIFALGIVLFELITMENAFGGDSMEETLRAIRICKSSARERHADKIPEDIVPILDRSMTLKVEDRFSDCEHMALVLDLTLRNRNPMYAPSDVAAFMRVLFGTDQDLRRKKLRAFAESGPIPLKAAKQEDFTVAETVRATPKKNGRAVFELLRELLKR